MEREFIITNEFEKCWKINKLTEEEMRQLELYLLQNPDAGDLVKETGGLRKLRWSLTNSGKSGGIRIAYVDFANVGKIYLLSAYAKSDKENLTKEECKVIKKYIKYLQKQLDRK